MGCSGYERIYVRFPWLIAVRIKKKIMKKPTTINPCRQHSVLLIGHTPDFSPLELSTLGYHVRHIYAIHEFLKIFVITDFASGRWNLPKHTHILPRALRGRWDVVIAEADRSDSGLIGQSGREVLAGVQSGLQTTKIRLIPPGKTVAELFGTRVDAGQRACPKPPPYLMPMTAA